MSPHQRAALAALPPIAALTLALTTTPRRPADPAPAPPAVDAHAPAPAPAPRSAPAPRDAVAVARRATRHLLRSEHNATATAPARTFTPALHRELRTRPPRPAARRVRPARIVMAREQTPVGGLRRVHLTLRRAGRHEHLTVLLACTPDCRVASVE